MKKKNKTTFTNTIKYNHSYISIIKAESNASNYFSSNTSITSIPIYSSNSIIYVTEKVEESKCKQIPYTISYTKEIEGLTIEEIESQFAPIFIKANSIMIPKKSEYNLRMHVPKKDLKKIHKDENIAIEMCLIYLSNLSSTYYTENKWKALNSTILNNQFKWKSDNTYLYSKIKKILLKGTKKTGPFVEVKKNEAGNESYIIGEVSIQYKFTNTYLKPGLTEYIITDTNLIKKRREFILNKIQKASKNIICRNLFPFYEQITLPTNKELLMKARKLAKKRHKTKKEKLLTFRNKHSNSHWKNPKKRSFVEDNIKLFEYLTKRGFMIPQPGDDDSGGRVVDSFTLMPSWIRNMCKINGKPIKEIDYSTLHPNIAMEIYGGSGRYINHSDVAKYLGIPRSKAKKNHLSFFNEKIEKMKHYDVFDYWFNKELCMLENIYKDKLSSKYKHYITSRRLFKIEVQIMTQAIKELNDMNIYVGYVYDALLCTPENEYVVKTIMNKVVKEFNINTHVK